MRYKFRSISDLFVENQRIFVHPRRNSGSPLPNWIDEYENRVNVLIEIFCNTYLQYTLSTQPEDQRIIYKSIKICDKILCDLRFSNNIYTNEDDTNNYEIYFRCTYITVQGEQKNIEKIFNSNSFPEYSHVKETIINWFEEINIDLDEIMSSAQVTSSNPDESAFDYEGLYS
jgi:hypothetical protein